MLFKPSDGLRASEMHSRYMAMMRAALKLCTNNE